MACSGSSLQGFWGGGVSFTKTPLHPGVEGLLWPVRSRWDYVWAGDQMIQAGETALVLLLVPLLLTLSPPHLDTAVQT